MHVLFSPPTCHTCHPSTLLDHHHSYFNPFQRFVVNLYSLQDQPHEYF